MPVRVKVSKREKDNGFNELVGSLGEMANITLGIHKEQGEQKHPNSKLTVAQLGAAHELGLVSGAPARPWLRAWLDANRDRLKRETFEAFKQVMARKVSRKKAAIDLGYRWTAEIRDWIAKGHVTPPLAQATIDRKGHAIPLLDSLTLVNSIEYRVRLPQKKSVKDPEQRKLLFGGGS